MKRIFFGIIALLFVAAPLFAQNANQTQLRLVVVDETGAGIPQATIIVTPTSGPALTFSTDDRGLATSPALTPGDRRSPRQLVHHHARTERDRRTARGSG
jgi:hypothetical protein